jgi:hypothetical protein
VDALPVANVFVSDHVGDLGHGSTF